MGPYLGTPNKEKESENGENDVCKWGATSMQGWRKSQEDAHIARTDLPDGVCCFGVFDGHGGKEVSIYVKEKFVEELVKLEEFKNRQYGEALKRNFRRMDELMLSEEGKARLKAISDEHGNPDPFAGGIRTGEDQNVA
jgi:protein phosphatase 1G